MAKSVLDPFEVAEMEMWPLWDLEGQGKGSATAKSSLNSVEYSVFQKLLADSMFGAVLNEKPPIPSPLVNLPTSLRAPIVPDPVNERRKHSDLRVARRASTIARLAQVISERAVHPGLRHTLLVQARRLEHLANQRLEESGGLPDPSEAPGSEEDSDV